MPPAAQLHAENLSLQSVVAARQGTLTAAPAEIAQLKGQIAWLKHRLCGPGRGDGARQRGDGHAAGWPRSAAQG